RPGRAAEHTLLRLLCGGCARSLAVTTMIAESAAQVVSLLAPLLVVVLVAAVLASASGAGSAREREEAEAEAEARAREWARFVFGPEADDERAPPPPSRRVLVVARHDGCG
ncbi:Os03g0710550, partial [Oryza sativa Japonica Group]